MWTAVVDEKAALAALAEADRAHYEEQECPHPQRCRVTIMSLTVCYLTGRAVATDATWREAAEWPPHPARLFSAMVDALRAGTNDSAERAALLWLECQSPPALSHSEASWRDTPTTYVPVNDKSDFFERKTKGGRATLTERLIGACVPASPTTAHAPLVTPHDPLVHFTWADAEPATINAREPRVPGVAGCPARAFLFARFYPGM